MNFSFFLKMKKTQKNKPQFMSEQWNWKTNASNALILIGTIIVVHIKMNCDGKFNCYKVKMWLLIKQLQKPISLRTQHILRKNADCWIKSIYEITTPMHSINVNK